MNEKPWIASPSLPMKKIALAIALTTSLAGCSDEEEANKAPTANAGADISVFEGSSVTLAGSARQLYRSKIGSFSAMPLKKYSPAPLAVKSQPKTQAKGPDSIYKARFKRLLIALRMRNYRKLIQSQSPFLKALMK